MGRETAMELLAPPPTPKTRTCLKCRESFVSTDCRICPPCSAENERLGISAERAFQDAPTGEPKTRYRGKMMVTWEMESLG